MKRFKKSVMAAILVCATFVAALSYGSTAYAADDKSDKDNKAAAQTIYDGVYLDGVYVGGLTKEEALKEYDEFTKNIDKLNLKLKTDVGTYSIPFKDIKLSVSPEHAVDQAYAYGRQGNILSRYKEIKSLEADNVILVPEKEIDETIMKDKLENETQGIIQEPENASITRENGEFKIAPGKSGVVIKVDDTMKVIAEELAKEWTGKDLTVNCAVEKKDPQYTEDDYKMIDSVMGVAETGYTQGGNRAKNLATGASKVSGTVLLPGEQFSMTDTVTPFTEENGYANAGQYVDNELVDGMGGGICQVTTTLYNAVIKAELQVDERHNHTLSVGYVKLSRDAAIAEGLFDFKFTNSSNYPIYIEGYAGGGVVSFAIYGHDERPSNRTIEFETKVISETEPPDPVTELDPNLDEGTSEVEEAGHKGYYAELWKNIYIDGKLTDSVRVNASNYQTTKPKVRVGTRKVSEEATTQTQVTETNTSADNPNPANTETPTPAPENPEAPAPTGVSKKVGK